MNLDTCTPGQRHVVRTLDHPLVVAAGAGSGKTFTLTQRIAAALLPGEGGRKPFVESLDEVLAITYTNKAAAELRSRIKQQLLDEGLEEEALKADDAWVSTIHGMCSRLLREHALEFGIDPAFELIMGAEAERLFDRALLSAYDRMQPDASGALGRYFSSRPLKTDAPGGHSVSSDVHAVIDCVTAQPGGFAAYVSPEPSKTCRQILRELRNLGDLLESHALCWKKPNKTEQKLIDALPAVFEQLDEALAGRIPNFDEDDFDPAAFIDLVFALPPTSQKFHGPDSKKDDAGFFEEYRSRYGSLGLEAQLCAYQPQMDAMVEFAQEVVCEYRKLKGPERLDNDDLILLAARALADHPDLAQACRDQFKLVMVDEFQDTNRVQVGLVRTIAANDCSNVCMVGDAQQSIYKFRGADVSVFFDYQEQVAALNPSAEVVELPDNFRSHADILSVVDKIFSTNDFFGERFLHLEPKGAVNKVADPVFDKRPRIELFVANAGRSTAPARFESAHAVAAHFADLREGGVEPGDMVLLLGSMSHASLFVEALREEGFQSIITGGSVFAAAVEVQIIACLLSWWANPLDSESLLALLTSVPFCLDEDCLMALCTNPATGGRWDLARGLQKWDPKVTFGLTPEELDRIDHVRGCLLDSAHRARTQSASVALREVFASSGWADLLESRGAVGLAQSGNVIKSQAILADLEEGLGLPQVAALFADHLASAKEAPGSLTTSSSQFVRIMTIHASKGLQFPHVALAELRMGNSRGLSGALKVGVTFVCMGRQAPSTAELKKATYVVKWMKEQEG
ncbi:MAG: UvrD-helicase domain-containing protein, partial [Coriobacteriia bacterium]|nr:UvrD-helicase domain-containing protein [Coriobacteriia bacterium]